MQFQAISDWWSLGAVLIGDPCLSICATFLAIPRDYDQWESILSIFSAMSCSRLAMVQTAASPKSTEATEKLVAKRGRRGVPCMPFFDSEHQCPPLAQSEIA
jgi:hypothetical protein